MIYAIKFYMDNGTIMKALIPTERMSKNPQDIEQFILETDFFISRAGFISLNKGKVTSVEYVTRQED